MQIRKEVPADYEMVYTIVKSAFESAEHSDGNEHNLVNDLRNGDALIPELSLIAEIDGIIVGHIMFTKAKVNEESLIVLAPLSVSPKFQNKGVGTALILEGHNLARTLGYTYSVVLGSDIYYSRIGYKSANEFGIKPPFDVPTEYFMAYRLKDNTPPLCGTLKYAKEFGIE